MKKSLLALAVLAVSGSAFATGNYHNPCGPRGCTNSGVVATGAQASGSNMVLSGSTASATASGAGSSSTSFASNVTTATTTVGVTATGSLTNANCDTNLLGAASATGSVALKSDSTAWNLSTGTGTGSAAAGGVATGQVSGSASAVGIVPNAGAVMTGTASGHAGASLASGVVAGRNGGAQEVAIAGGGFTAGVNIGLQTTGTCEGRVCVTTSDTKTAGTTARADAYSDKATFAVGGVSLSNAVAGSLVNATAGATAVTGGTASVGDTASTVIVK